MAHSTTGLFGDAIGIMDPINQTVSVGLNRIWASENARAGVAVFGTQAGLANSRLTCNDVDLAISQFGGVNAEIQDGGGNVCGCQEDGACKAARAEIAPPELLPLD